MSDGGLIYGLPNREIESLINEWIHSDRDRKIMRRRYIDGITYEIIAEEFELSVRQIKTIIYRHSKIIAKRAE